MKQKRQDNILKLALHNKSDIAQMKKPAIKKDPDMNRILNRNEYKVSLVIWATSTQEE